MDQSLTPARSGLLRPFHHIADKDDPLYGINGKILNDILPSLAPTIVEAPDTLQPIENDDVSRESVVLTHDYEFIRTLGKGASRRARTRDGAIMWCTRAVR